jgi:hypothetical protein
VESTSNEEREKDREATWWSPLFSLVRSFTIAFVYRCEMSIIIAVTFYINAAAG